VSADTKWLRGVLAEAACRARECFDCEGTGQSLQGWSANYGNQYGPCARGLTIADALLPVVDQEFAAARAEALREAAREARERGDIGKDGGYEAWDWLAIRADQAASIARTPDESEAR
jgi:hypothetical protein